MNQSEAIAAAAAMIRAEQEEGKENETMRKCTRPMNNNETKITAVRVDKKYEQII